MLRIRPALAVSLMLTSVAFYPGCGGNVEGSQDPSESGGAGTVPGAGGANVSGSLGRGGAAGSGAFSGASPSPRSGAFSGGGASPSPGSGAFSGGGASPSAGSGAAPGKGGRPFTTAGTSPGVGGCCLALPLCRPGDKQVPSCSGGADCYPVTACCSTITCESALQCEALPSCDSGDLQISGQCPPDGSCYVRSLCGTTIQCLHFDGVGGAAGAGGASGGEACDPAYEPDRRYVATNPRTCSLIDYSCPANTQYFGNACGCGCEQDASCPEWVDCMPGPASLDPLCFGQGLVACPYTLRAL